MYSLNSFLKLVDDIENRFHNIPGRSNRYYSKEKKKRTILTLLGEITFERTYYQDKSNEKCFFYVDLCLNLVKYRSIDSYLESLLLEETASASMAKSGRSIGRIISEDAKGLTLLFLGKP